MPVIIPAGFRQVSLNHLCPGASGDVLVVFGIEAIGTELNDLRAIMDAWQDEIVGPFLSSSVTFDEGRVLTGPRPGAPQRVLGYDPAKNFVGQQGADMLPVNNAVLWTLVSAVGGVRGRGRKYLPGAPEAAIDNAGIISPAGLGQFQTAADDFLAAAQANLAGELVILHGTGISATPVPTPIVAIYVQPKMATQRTRLRD